MTDKNQLDYQRRIILEELMCDDCYYKNNCKLQCEVEKMLESKDAE